MSFDTSRFIFDAWNNYNGVVMEQGRVQLDSDWNEWLAELMRRIQAGTLDTLGRAVYPATTPFAFQITATTDAAGNNHVNIGPGRMYVDGLLAENHGAQSDAVWDPALAELSGSPQPPGTTPTGTIDFTAQPYYPNAALPSGNGPFAAYLDVWTRPITYLEDPTLIDAAVNVDTTGRLQTVWQVKLAPLASGATCASAEAAPPWPGPSIGQLTNGYAGASTPGPCCMTSGTGYTGMENQFYRIEIHQPGTPATASTYPAAAGTATFKWSRDNRSVETGVTGIQTVTNSIGNKAAQLGVLSLGRDQVLGFGPGNWIEILDDDLELNGQPGELHMIDTVDFSAKTITLVDLLQTPADFPLNSTNQTTSSRHTRIRRWDQSGKIYQTGATPGDTTLWMDLGINGSTGDIPVPPPGTTLIVESGITITFGPEASTQFNTGDYWNFSARASNGQIDPLSAAPPRGIHHHYAMLSIVGFAPNSNPDCRIEWPPSSGASGSCCCTYTVGANAQYQSIQAAINALPDNGGEICILPGRYYENVFIENWDDVIIHGCGPQTRVASLALQPGYTPPAPAGGAGTTPSTTINAVFSVANSQDIQFRNFVVEAAPGEAGILIDGTGTLIAQQPGSSQDISNQNIFIDIGYELIPPVAEIVIEDMTITASDTPAILAKQAAYLYVRDSRIAMANVRGTFPAVWMSGKEIEFVRNIVGIQTEANLNTWVPGIVFLDLLEDASNAGTKLNESSVFLHKGGIMIAGPSTNVLVAENQITGGLGNGITLGSYAILDANGDDTNLTTGLAFAKETECTTTGSLQAPTTYPGISKSSVVASGRLVEINIDRNTISNFGLCGIGPVGFFDLTKSLEVISVADLTIAGNTITETVTRAIGDVTASEFYYAAISLPTVSDLIIRDNAVADFGPQPGLVAGIFLLHGETAEISRNQIIDDRDWSCVTAFEGAQSTGSGLGAITILIATPPTLPSSKGGFAALALFEPGLPALRIEENVVRVPLGMALLAFGYGPFSISDNHFSCGGKLPGDGKNTLKCVEVLNLGRGIELIPANTPSQAYSNGIAGGAAFNQDSSFASSSGAVLFTGNICQLELRDAPQAGFASVLIVSLDHITFSNNHCWLDASTSAETFGSIGMATDAFLLAGTVNAVGNRFQEAQYSVALSAITLAVVNITNQNISTNCIFADGANVLSTGNLTIIDTIAPGTCAQFQWTQP